MKDFQRIENFSVDAFVKLHQEDVNWLNEMVLKIAKEEPERKIMILTHHAPTIHGTSHPKLYGHPTNSAFATELLEEGEYSWKTSGNVEVWAFGHTHWCCEFDRGGIRVFSNQRGNGEGKEGFDNVSTLVLGGEEI